MSTIHDIPSYGHQGVQRTMAKAREMFCWWKMGTNIKTYVLTCDVCCRNKRGPLQSRAALKSYQAGSPLEKVHLEFLGPLLRTEAGNEYILMIVDSFTKWVECLPLPSQTAELTVQAAIMEFFVWFGYPFEMFTDQGRDFESKLFRKVCSLLQIHKSRTTHYRPSGNGQVERYNTLVDAVRCYLDNQAKFWDKHLDILAGAVQCAEKDTPDRPQIA